MKNIPNYLTLIRIMIIPLIILCFYIDSPKSNQIAALLFIIASITDFFDGYLARAWKAQSDLGKFFDPIADKLLVGTVIILLVESGGIGHFDVIAAIAIICREIFVSGLREFLAEINVSMPVSKLGKFKTFFQMAALFLLLLGNKGSGFEYTELIGGFALWVSAILTIASGYAYLKAGLKHMRSN